MPRDFDSFRSHVRDVLLDDWDPSNAARFPAAHGEYDPYVEPLPALVESAADADAAVEFLRERDCVCFPSPGTRRLRPVAQKRWALKSG